MSCACSRLAQFSQDPRESHYNEAAIRLVKCLLNTSSHSMCHRRNNETLKCMYKDFDSTHHNVAVSADSSFLSCEKTGRSQAGCVLFHGNAPVIWKSFLQRVVAGSTAEAEHMAMGEATRELIYSRQFLKELGVDDAVPSLLFEDNAPCIKIAENAGFTQRSKSIRTKCHMVREALDSKIIQIVKVPGTDNVADALTKSLTVARTKQYNRYLHGNAHMLQ